MQNLNRLIDTIQSNCHISDAKYAGNYSMCIFLLKMREYYRWENNIPLSQKLPTQEVGKWLVQREHCWEDIEDDVYHPLPLDGGQYDPFNPAAINKALIPLGYVYSGGYGLFNKPNFFLADLIRMEQRDGIDIFVSAHEHARDLAAPPAMLLDHTVFVRQDAVTRFLWEKLEEWRWQKTPDTAIGRAVHALGGNGDRKGVLDSLVQLQTEIVIRHELGEVRAGGILGHDWESLLASIPRSKAEFIIRAIRDNLADCLVTLPYLLAGADTAALHLYFANFSGMRQTLFPTAMIAYQIWNTTHDLAPLQKVVDAGTAYWSGIGTDIMSWHAVDAKAVVPRVENLLEAQPPFPIHFHADTVANGKH